MIFAYFLFALYDVFPSKQLAEIVRAGVNALPWGQREAAAAVGLRPGQRMRLVLLPQAITAMPPAVARASAEMDTAGA